MSSIYRSNVEFINGFNNLVTVTTGSGDQNTFSARNRDSNRNSIQFNHRADVGDVVYDSQTNIPSFNFNGQLIRFSNSGATGTTVGTNGYSTSRADFSELEVRNPITSIPIIDRSTGNSFSLDSLFRSFRS